MDVSSASSESVFMAFEEVTVPSTAALSYGPCYSDRSIASCRHATLQVARSDARHRQVSTDAALCNISFECSTIFISSSNHTQSKRATAITMADTAYLRTTTLPTGLRIAQVVGLTSTALLAGERAEILQHTSILLHHLQTIALGKTFAQTVSAIPALLHAPAPLLAKQWKTMFDGDKLLAPIIVLYSSSIFGYLAWRGKVSSTTPQHHTPTSPKTRLGSNQQPPTP